MNTSIIEIPTRLSTFGSVRLIAERKAGLLEHMGSLTAQDEARYAQFFLCLAADYNDIMRAEYNHRRAYGCQSNWECKCPVHKQLHSDCISKLWQPVEQVEVSANQAKYEPLTAEWWADKGLRLVKPVANPDPLLDWIELPDGSLPVLPQLHERAAHWLVNSLVSGLPGSLLPGDGIDDWHHMYYQRFLSIDWTTELRSKLEEELLKGLKQRIIFAAPPEGLDPISIGWGRWGHDSFIGDACRAAGIGMPVMQTDLKMLVTPGSIAIEQRVVSAV